MTRSIERSPKRRGSPGARCARGQHPTTAPSPLQLRQAAGQALTEKVWFT